MTLSVCCLTADPGPQVRAALEPLRAVADEVVVAADQRVPREWLRDYGSVADRLFDLEVVAPERHMRWLHDQCSCDWVLRIDGDEVVSSKLLALLPELLAARDVFQYAVPTRWLYPDARHWLEELPWWPDYHLRLVRNDGLLRFPGLPHTEPVPVRPTRYLDAPLYHLALLAGSREARPSTTLRHEGEELELTAHGGGRLVERFYRPDRYIRRPPARVPRDDRRAIAAVLAARPGSESGSVAPAARVSASETDRRWAERNVDPSAYVARITPLEPDYRMALCEQRSLFFRVENAGSERWHWDLGLPPSFRAAYRWWLREGRLFVPEGPRSAFPCEVCPGDEIILPLHVRAPGRAGRYLLEVELVHEHVRWFGDPLRVWVDVTPPDGAPRRPSRLVRRLRAGRLRGSIPRVIHRIWLGGTPLPDEAARFGETWARHHPDWELRLWGDELLDLLPADCVARARSESELSNLLRYEVLHRHGGVYVDADVECLRPLDPLLEGVKAFAAWETPESVGTAVMGAVSGHPLFEEAAREARLTVGLGINSPEATGPQFFTLVVEDHPEVTLFDSKLFYPYRWDERERRFERFPEAFAVHHWDLSWVPQGSGG